MSGWRVSSEPGEGCCSLGRMIPYGCKASSLSRQYGLPGEWASYEQSQEGKP